MAMRALGWALLLIIAQIGITMALVPGPADPAERYLKLNNWDSFHYSDLLENGYHMPPPDHVVTSPDVHELRANLGYFPGYLVACRAVRRLIPEASTYTVLLVTAQVFGVVFWFYLYLLFATGGVPRGRIPWYLAAIAIYPSAFFLVAGYSESTFMAFLVGFIYWCDRWAVAAESASSHGHGNRNGRGGGNGWVRLYWVLALLHGFAMVGTRIVGIPVVAYPVVRYLAGRSKIGRPLFLGSPPLWAAGAISALSLTAAVGFLAYCQSRFGHWDWYFRLQTIGWGKDPNYLALFDPRSYVPRFFFEDTVTSISRTAVPFTAWLLWRDFRADWSRGKVWERVALYFAAFSLFYIALAAKADTNMDSMIRYTWPAVALLTVGWAQIQKERWDAGFAKPARLHPLWIASIVLSIAIQVWFAHRFLRGRWVA